MISEEKKEEVRAAADIVEVVSDYVKLKRSGSGFMGLCPYHDEKTPSFHVTPRLGIFKCFGCGESGDVFRFVMDREGVGFTEAVRSLAERYGVYIPEEQEEIPDEHYQLKEGIYHALKFAGLFYYRNLIENSEAEEARSYLTARGYNREVFKRFGLGYSPGSGSALLKAAENANIDEKYLLEADLIKHGRSGGYYDTFRGRLMFPIFGVTGKVIAFAGRILGKEKTAKYINSAQTKVYNKSEVLYGLNFSKNEIRKDKEVILVEGYTDVITLFEHGIKNVTASSGTALTPGQMRQLHKYGDRILLLYDADGAGETAMKRGIEIALSEGMLPELLELPEGEDPDSFVKQFGKESFLSYKKEHALGFVDFIMLKAEEEGLLQNPALQSKTITDVLEAIASIKDTIQRQVYVQHLHQKTQQFRRGTDRELFEELERILYRKKQEAERSRKREIREWQQQKEEVPAVQPQEGIPDESTVPGAPVTERRPRAAGAHRQRRAKYEKEIIRLLLVHGKDMIEYIGSFVHEDMFENEGLKVFYLDIFSRYEKELEISPGVYSGMQGDFPGLLSDVLMEQYTVSERHHEVVGEFYSRDKHPFATAASAMKALEISYCTRKRKEFADKLSGADLEEKKKLIAAQAQVQKRLRELETREIEKLYPWQGIAGTDTAEEERFEYKMRDKN